MFRSYGHKGGADKGDGIDRGGVSGVDIGYGYKGGVDKGG